MTLTVIGAISAKSPTIRQRRNRLGSLAALWLPSRLSTQQIDYQTGSTDCMGRYEPGARLYVVNPTFGRIASALVATTLDLTQKIMAKPNIVATIAKLVFLRMGASDLDRSDSRCNSRCKHSCPCRPRL